MAMFDTVDITSACGDNRFDVTAKNWMAPSNLLPAPGAKGWVPSEPNGPMVGSKEWNNSEGAGASHGGGMAIGAFCLAVLLTFVGIFGYAIPTANLTAALESESWDTSEDNVDAEFKDGKLYITYYHYLIGRHPVATWEYQVAGPSVVQIRRSSSQDWETYEMRVDSGTLYISPPLLKDHGTSESWY